MNWKKLYLGRFQLIVWFILISLVEGKIIYAVTGGSILLDCRSSNAIRNLSSTASTVVEWKKHGVLYQQITYRKEPAAGWNSPTLHLDQLLLADSGIYHCMLTQNGSIIENKTFSVHVIAENMPRKPQITSTSMNKNMSVFVNEKITLKCHARSSEAPYVRWYFRKKTISSSRIAKLVLDHTGIAFTSKLVLEKKTLREGSYTCFVFNQYGVHSKSVYVQVKPVPPKTKTELANAYEQKYIDDDSVPLGVVIGIPVSALVILLAAALTLYERYSWRQTGRRPSRGGSERSSMLKPNEINMSEEDQNKNCKGKNDLNGDIRRISSQDVFFSEERDLEEGGDILKEISSEQNKSLSSFNPEIDLEWEGMELGPLMTVQEEMSEPKPSIALPEDDSSFYTQEDLWELFDTDRYRTRPVLISKDEMKSNSGTETIV